ncbi:MAG TPA: hypothetical protein VD948_06055 [Rhodothermales bacterium]|nr:hypothetical protein [Rhodothermales bacterium]
MGVQTNIASIAPALNQLVKGPLRDQYEQQTKVWSLFGEGEGEFINGKGFRIPSRFRPSTGLTYGSEGFSFNQPGAAVLDDMYVYPCAVAMSYEFTGRVLRNVKDDSSLIKGIGGLLQEKTKALAKEMEIGVFNDGSAQRAIFKSASGTTFTFYNSTSHTPLAGFGSTNGSMHLRQNEYYDVYDATGATFRGTVQVTSKAASTTAVVNAAPAGMTDTDIFVTANGLNKAPRGLPYIVNNDTGVFQLLSRSTYPELKSPVTDLNGSAISVAEFVKTRALLEARSDEGKAMKLTAIVSIAQEDALLRLGQNLKRFDGGAKKFDGSFDEFGFGGWSFVKAKDCDQDRIYFIDVASIDRYTEMPFGDYDFDGQQLRMKAGISGYGSDAGTGAIGWQGNLGATQPRNFALIKRAAVSGLASLVAAN